MVTGSFETFEEVLDLSDEDFMNVWGPHVRNSILEY